MNFRTYRDIIESCYDETEERIDEFDIEMVTQKITDLENTKSDLTEQLKEVNQNLYRLYRKKKEMKDKKGGRRK